MGVNTVSAAIHITPVVIKTFLEHGKRRAQKYQNSIEEEEARDDIFFDEAFNIVKAFIELGIHNTVESLQAFTNTHVPAPYWAAVVPVRVPLTMCNAAADLLNNWFGPEAIQHVVGGERWWQVRGLDGVDCEWITEKEYLSDKTAKSDKLSQLDETLLRMEHLETVMLYVHGGGFSWGSINTHRYQIIRYARKIRGRAFAVNYRKAPQYPFPCPLQDVLAAYLYLIQPPPTARHRPIPPSKIVFAGDSAGGNLCLSALTILRDIGLPLPSGAVLISPWVDLTHSFPSVMNNMKTDIIPEHGFLAKPSTAWPVHPVPPKGGRVCPTESNPPPKPGHADTLFPSADRIQKDEAEDAAESVRNQEEMLQQIDQSGAPSMDRADEVYHSIDFWEPKPPKVLMEDPSAVPLELRCQIQQYATTEQLTHPLVSPVVQGSLGNLPPLYIIAGDGEVLRDEIVYLAHRAAHPEQYPTRHGVLKSGNRQKENASKFTTPTKVHLQVFDDMCHVLTAFSFTRSAKFAYRSIAEFVKHVTRGDTDAEPFPELQTLPSRASAENETLDENQKKRRTLAQMLTRKTPSNSKQDALRHQSTGVRLYNQEAAAVAHQVRTLGQGSSSSSSTAVTNGDRLETANSRKNGTFIMVRERINIHGVVRDMEPEEELSCLQIPSSQIGLIKEAPAVRWSKGQDRWDQMYAKSAARVLKRRERIARKYEELLRNARSQGLLLACDEGCSERTEIRNVSTERSTSADPVDGTIREDRRWGPLDLDEEHPPPSAISKRRDTHEALALLKMSIYHSAPVTHRNVPKLKASDAVKAAFDPHDDPMRPPKQSVSEQQVRTYMIPGMHGLRIWDAILRYFMEEKTKRAKRCLKR